MYAAFEYYNVMYIDACSETSGQRNIVNIMRKILLLYQQ